MLDLETYVVLLKNSPANRLGRSLPRPRSGCGRVRVRRRNVEHRAGSATADRVGSPTGSRIEVRERRAEAHRRAERAAARERARERSEAREQAEAEESTEAESSECDPNYSGACLDPYASDYDCEGGSGNGPSYTGPVVVVGDDHYELDADGDLAGCEPP
jgi:hypothetical protein